MNPATLGTIVSVRTGVVREMPRPAWDRLPGATWSSAFLKEERPGPVRIGPLGLEGDEQADRSVHGGPEMAVLMYAAVHYEAWRREPGLERMGPGGFGENLTVDPLSETGVCIGDVLRVGGSRLQVASPRGPCQSISRRWDDPQLLRRVTERLWTGWYLRVLEPGEVAAGDTIELADRPNPAWSVLRLLELRFRGAHDHEARRTASRLAELDADWRRRLDPESGALER